MITHNVPGSFHHMLQLCSALQKNHGDIVEHKRSSTANGKVTIHSVRNLYFWFKYNLGQKY